MPSPSAAQRFRTDPELVAYYDRRALEYDRIYDKPERQRDLALLRRRVAETFAGERVLEVACGTGYWTETLAAAAADVVATDRSVAMVRRATARRFDRRVALVVTDLARLAIRRSPTGNGPTAAFAGFLWSHLPSEQLADARARLHAVLPPGAPVVWIDNRFVEGSSSPVSPPDAGGDRRQERTLDDGSRYEIVKNFPTPGELRAGLGPSVAEVNVESLEYYWWLSYRIPCPGDSP